MKLDDQIAFIDEMIGHASQMEEIEALAAIRESLVGLQNPSKRKNRSTKEAEPVIKLAHYQEFVGVYDQFCRKEVGAPGEIDSRQGLALKKTVEYIMKQERVGGDELKALEGWKYIFQNWSMLTNFIKRQVKLTDIKKNIQEILFQLRNASKEAKQRKADSDWDQYRELRKGE